MGTRASVGAGIAVVAAILVVAWPRGDGGDDVLRLATTTSTRDSGLLDVLLPMFEPGCGCRVDVIAAGTGTALKLGAAGDVDALLVHAQDAELAFMEAGHGIRREPVMVNRFELLGPPADPAAVRGARAAPALQGIAAGSHPFVSRGDESGTHRRELALWEAGGGRPAPWPGYVESGQGMGATLVMADQMRAYVLADRGTYLAFHERIELVPLAAPGPELDNPYAVIVVDPHEHAADGAPLAHAFTDFLISGPAQEAIRDHTVGGERLFTPLRLGEDAP